MAYRFLEPIKIGSATLKNRIVYSAMVKNMCTEDGFVTDQYVEYYRNLANGGVGLIIPGAMVVDPEWPFVFYRQPWVNDEAHVAGLKRVTEAVHAADTKIIFQLWHPGQYTMGGTAPKTINELTVEEIKHIEDLFEIGAKNAMAAGADGIEFHHAHNFLPAQFMSAFFNKRTDEYACDTVENACRFSLDCIKRIRAVLGPDKILAVKMNGHDFVEGGITPEWCAKAAAYIEQAGVDMFTINAGGPITRLTGMSGDGDVAEGWKIDFAATVKAAVKAPVGATGSLRHPKQIEELLAEGKGDFAVIGRGLLAEPNWVNKVKAGQEDVLRYCISCGYCTLPNSGDTPGCSVNPLAKREYLKKELRMDGAGRNIVVVGAGPAGLEAAVTLAKRGFKPVIFEKRGAIGGAVAEAALLPGEEKFAWMIEYYANEIKRNNIECRFNTEPTLDDIKAFDPYAVVFATGSTPKKLGVPGEDGENVIDTRKYLYDGKPEIKGKKIVVIGNNLEGVGIARELRKNNEVTMLELQAAPAAPVALRFRQAYAAREGVAMVMGAQIERITAQGVYAKKPDAAQAELFEADLVVKSIGNIANGAAYAKMGGQFPLTYNIGDSGKPGGIMKAVWEGSEVGYDLT